MPLRLTVAAVPRCLALAAVAALGACDADDGMRQVGSTTDLAVADLAAAADLAMPGDDVGARDMSHRNDGGGLDGGVPDVVTQLAGVVVSTFAGSGTAGAIDGVGTAARFDNPVGLVLDATGLLYVTEYDGNRIRTLAPDGQSSTIVADVTAPADFACPFAVAIVGADKLLVQTDCDVTGNKDVATSVLWTIDIATGTPTPLVQGLGRPRGLAPLDAAHVAVSDRTHQTLQTLAVSSGALTPLAGALDTAGFKDATGSAARFDGPYGLAAWPLAGSGFIVADSDNHRVRNVSAAGAVTTLAGGTVSATIDAKKAADARFISPKVVAIDSARNVYLTDAGAHRVRRIRTDGTVETLAGDGTAGFRDGAGGQAQFYGLEGIAVTPDGKKLYVSDGNGGDGGPYHRIRLLTLP